MAGYKSKAIVGTGGGMAAMNSSSAQPIDAIPMRGAMMTAGNFNRVATKVSPGSGWIHTIPIPLNATFVSGFSLALTDGSVVAVMDTNTYTIAVNFVVPGNYDRNKDKLRLVVFAIAVGVSKLSVTGLSYWRDAVAAVTAPTLSSTQDDEQTVSTTLFTKYTFDLSSLGLRPYDSATITLGSTTVETSISVRGLEVEYAGSLVNADPALRA